MPWTLPRLVALVVVIAIAAGWPVDAQQSGAPLVTRATTASTAADR